MDQTNVTDSRDHGDLVLPECGVVRLEPGDVLVLRHPRLLSNQQKAFIEAELEKRFPGHMAIAICDGARLEVLRPAQ